MLCCRVRRGSQNRCCDRPTEATDYYAAKFEMHVIQIVASESWSFSRGLVEPTKGRFSKEASPGFSVLINRFMAHLRLHLVSLSYDEKSQKHNKLFTMRQVGLPNQKMVRMMTMKQMMNTIEKLEEH